MERLALRRWGGALVLGGTATLACSPKVDLEFDDATDGLTSLPGTFGTNPGEASDGSFPGDDDDDESSGSAPNSTSSSTSSSSWGEVSTSGWDSVNPSTATQGDPDPTSEVSTSSIGCYDDRECPDGRVCLYGECVAACDEYCCIESMKDPNCCPSGVYDIAGACCPTEVDAGGNCIGNPCEVDRDCDGHLLCGPSSQCEAVSRAVECGTASSLVTRPLDGFAEPPFDVTASVAAGDFDGDGARGGFVAHQFDLGLFWVADYSQSREWAAIEGGSAFIPTEIVLGDLTGDGRDDLVVSYPAEPLVQVQISTPDGWVETSRFESFGQGLAISDFDADGFNDLVGSFDGELIVWFGQGEGEFTEGIGPALEASAVDVSDFDSDGAPDIAFASERSIGVVGVTPMRNFVEKLQRAQTGPPFDLEMADMDDDGAIDLALLGETNRGSVLYVWSGAAVEEPPLRMYFAERTFSSIALAPPNDRYLVLAGPSGQVHVRDFLPACWSWIDENVVLEIAPGFTPSGGAERTLLLAGGGGLRVTAPGG